MATKDKTEAPLAKVEELHPLAIMDPKRRISLDALTEELDGEMIGMSLFTRVKMPAGGGRTWEIENPDDLNKPETPQSITGVVVHSQRVNGYWSKSMEEGGNVPPDCSSNDGVIGQGHRGIPADDASPVHECASCPLNAFGSDPSGGKACKNRWLLFVLRPEDAMPLLLSLSPASLKPYKEFITAQFVKKHRTRGTYFVEIGLEKATSAGQIVYSKATFGYAGDLTKEQAETVSAFRTDLAAFVSSNAAALLVDAAGVEPGAGEAF